MKDGLGASAQLTSSGPATANSGSQAIDRNWRISPFRGRQRCRPKGGDRTAGRAATKQFVGLFGTVCNGQSTIPSRAGANECAASARLVSDHLSPSQANGLYAHIAPAVGFISLKSGVLERSSRYPGF